MQYSRKRMVALVLAAGVCSPAPASDWSASVGGDLRWFDWREYRDGEQLLSESGPLAAPLLRLEWQREALYASVESLWGGGQARYDGRLNNSGAAYSADAWEEIIDTDWRLGWRQERGGIHVGFLQRDWRRQVEGSATVPSAEERYRWSFVTLGGEVVFLGSPDWRLAVTLGLPVDSYQKAYTATYDDLVLEPGDGVFWRLSFPWQPDRARGGPLSLEPYYQEQHMGRSDAVELTLDGVPQGQQFYQPASIRRELGLTLRWRLGGMAAEEPAAAPADQAIPAAPL